MSEEINHERRRLLGSAVLTIAAATGSAAGICPGCGRRQRLLIGRVALDEPAHGIGLETARLLVAR